MKMEKHKKITDEIAINLGKRTPVAQLSRSPPHA